MCSIRKASLISWSRSEGDHRSPSICKHRQIVKEIPNQISVQKRQHLPLSVRCASEMEAKSQKTVLCRHNEAFDYKKLVGPRGPINPNKSRFPTMFRHILDCGRENRRDSVQSEKPRKIWHRPRTIRMTQPLGVGLAGVIQKGVKQFGLLSLNGISDCACMTYRITGVGCSVSPNHR
jgi:hypothetical protein